MATRPPVHRSVSVFAAVLATLCFALSASLDSGLRWVLMGLGFVLLVVAIASLTALRKDAPDSGWLPSRDAEDER